MRFRRSLVSALFALAWRAGAQSTPVASDSSGRMERVAPGVYAIIHRDAVHTFPDGAMDWPHGNTGVIVGSRGVMVIDSDFYPSRAAQDIALIRRVTRLPVRYLVNTHWDGDHTHGNAVYRDSFPDIEIVGSRDNAQFVGINQARFPLSQIAPGSLTRKIADESEAMLARGTDSAGRAFTGAERALLTRVIAERRAQLAEFAMVRPAPPTRLFDRTTSIDLGGRRVDLVNRGHANSPSDVTAYVPESGVLFTGDILVWPVPYTFDSYPRPWVAVLRDLEGMRAKAIVPGHGPVFRDQIYLRQVRELIARAVTVTDSLSRLGKVRPEIDRLLDLSAFKPLFVRDGDVDAMAYWRAAIVNSLPERAVQCNLGSRC